MWANVIAYLVTLFCMRIALGRDQFEHWQILVSITAGVGVMIGNYLVQLVF